MEEGGQVHLRGPDYTLVPLSATTFYAVQDEDVEVQFTHDVGGRFQRLALIFPFNTATASRSAEG